MTPRSDSEAISMMTSSNGNIFRVTGPLCGEFTGPGEFPTQRPVTRSFDIFFDRRLNERLSKQPRGWWLETLSCSLWRQSNAVRPSRWSNQCPYRLSIEIFHWLYRLLAATLTSSQICRSVRGISTACPNPPRLHVSHARYHRRFQDNPNRTHGCH